MPTALSIPPIIVTARKMANAIAKYLIIFCIIEKKSLNMLENFMFSVNATIPIFLVMVFGFFLRTKNLINDNFVEVANKFVFVIALPTLVFLDLASTDFREVFDITYVVFCAGVTTICFFVSLNV